MPRQINMNISGRPISAGAYVSTGMTLDTDWHQHEMHQLLYAFEGMVRIEDEEAMYLVPHQFAAWIPADTPHRTTLHNVKSGSIFLNPDKVQTDVRRVKIVRVPALMREMIKGAMRWSIVEGYDDEAGISYFNTFALLCREWLTNEAKLIIPTCGDARVGKIIAYTMEHLSEVKIDDVCMAVGMSERTLRRRFAANMGLSWDNFRTRCRIFRAIELLEKSDLSILRIANEVGYNSPSAFARAFKALLRESPADYRKRIADR